VPHRNPTAAGTVPTDPVRSKFGRVPDASAAIAGGSGHGTDGGAPGHSKHCLIAEVIHGVDTPRTQLVRARLTECYERREPWSLVVVPLYRRFGQRIAAFLRSWPVFKNVFRPLFDLGVRRARRDRAAALFAMRAIANSSV